MFHELLNFTRLTISMGVSRYWPKCYFRVSLSFQDQIYFGQTTKQNTTALSKVTYFTFQKSKNIDYNSINVTNKSNTQKTNNLKNGCIYFTILIPHYLSLLSNDSFFTKILNTLLEALSSLA